MQHRTPAAPARASRGPGRPTSIALRSLPTSPSPAHGFVPPPQQQAARIQSGRTLAARAVLADAPRVAQNPAPSPRCHVRAPVTGGGRIAPRIPPRPPHRPSPPTSPAYQPLPAPSSTPHSSSARRMTTTDARRAARAPAFLRSVLVFVTYTGAHNGINGTQGATVRAVFLELCVGEDGGDGRVARLTCMQEQRLCMLSRLCSRGVA
eukprot:362504-Chlamydomonas_euryale.AAC.13